MSDQKCRGLFRPGSQKCLLGCGSDKSAHQVNHRYDEGVTRVQEVGEERESDQFYPSRRRYIPMSRPS